MKKLISLAMATVMAAGIFSGCGGNRANSISVISREDGSGTRGAFVELFKVEDVDGNDATLDTAEITNSTSVMLTTVSGNRAAIGYVSLGSLSSDVKAVKVDGVDATVENINNGSYTIARPFNIVYQEGTLSELDQDFLNFIMSKDGQEIIADKGYISVSEGETYAPAGLSGTVTLAGSTSVAPVMEVLADKYKELNSGVTIEIQQSGSSAGITSAIEGVCSFGMSSRELKPDEASRLTCVKMAMDGIAVIVNNANSVSDLTSEQVRQIFMGELTDWNKLA
mgnify:CR=1 FL=1